MFHIQLFTGSEDSVEMAYKCLIASCQNADLAEPNPLIARLLNTPFGDWTDQDYTDCHTITDGHVGLDFNLIRGDPPHPASDHRLANLPLDQWNDDDFDTARRVHEEIHKDVGVKAGATRLLRYFARLEMGEIGLVRGGVTPVALVRISEPYVFFPHAEYSRSQWCWFRHRFPVDILGWYRRDQDRFGLDLRPPAMGAFGRLINRDVNTYRQTELWNNQVVQNPRGDRPNNRQPTCHQPTASDVERLLRDFFQANEVPINDVMDRYEAEYRQGGMGVPLCPDWRERLMDELCGSNDEAQ